MRGLFIAMVIVVVTAIGLMTYRIVVGDPNGRPAPTEISEEATPENTVIMTLESGEVTIQLLPSLAPKHVARFKRLVREGFYDGLKFHRVLPGFMAQTGDPTGTGTGGSPYPNLPAEFSWVPFERGVVGMARARDFNSANSQFFITTGRAKHLDNSYTVFGRVTEGMDLFDKLKAGTQPDNGMVKDDPDIIVKMQMAETAE